MDAGRAPPSSSDPSEILTEILAPFGLATRPGPGRALLIVRDSRAADAAWTGLAETDATGAHEPVNRETLPGNATPATPSIEEIIVAASQFQLARSIGGSVNLLSSEDIEYMPDLGDDALRRMARLPGVVTDSVSARSNVRGGETRETAVRFDGLRLHNPFHLKDFNSVFSGIDPRTVDSMDVYTGGVPAMFGDSLSGVVDVTSMTPPGTLYREVAFSLFNTSLLSAGHIGDDVDDGAWVASLRRGNLDLLHETSDKHIGRPTYEDAYAKGAFRVNERLRVTANLLYVGDDIFLAEPDGEHEGQVVGQDHYYWLRLDHNPDAVWEGTTLVARTQLVSERAGYSWSRVADRIDGGNQPRSWDRTHALSAGLSWDTDNWNIGGAVASHSGWPMTPVALGGGGDIVALDERNSARVGRYSAVDLRITRKFQRRRSAGSVYLELTNLFDRSNPFSQEYELARGASGDELRLETLHTLPRIPSLGVIWSF